MRQLMFGDRVVVATAGLKFSRYEDLNFVVAEMRINARQARAKLPVVKLDRLNFDLHPIFQLGQSQADRSPLVAECAGADGPALHALQVGTAITIVVLNGTVVAGDVDHHVARQREIATCSVCRVGKAERAQQYGTDERAKYHYALTIAQQDGVVKRCL